MTGPIDSVIGDDTDNVLKRFLTSMPHHMMVGKGRSMLNAILMEINREGRAVKIERIYREND
jgi:calcineurin-like phosphoesterase